MNLLPQDVFILLKLAVSAPQEWSYSTLAHELDMSPSMAHSGIKRSTQARLFDPNRRRPRLKALEEFLIHGVKYAFPPDLGSITRGVPTAYASPPLQNRLAYDESEIYVWPYPEGTHRGISLSPLYKSVPKVALQDERLYAALGLLDVLRLGRAREQQMAEELFKEMLRSNG